MSWWFESPVLHHKVRQATVTEKKYEKMADRQNTQGSKEVQVRTEMYNPKQNPYIKDFKNKTWSKQNIYLK